MKTVVALLLSLLPLRAEPPANPALGMTPAELAAKYGADGQDAGKDRQPPAERALRFTKNGVSITVQIWRGRAAGLNYFRRQDFSVEEVEALLAANASGWVLVAGASQPRGSTRPTLWLARGFSAAFASDVNMLMLETEAFTAAQKALRQAIGAERVKGL